MKAHIKGTVIFQRKGRFYKVITARHTEDNWWTFECKDLKTKQSQVLKYQVLGMLEAMDAAASKMKNPKDILLMDFDNKGKWGIMTHNQIEKILKAH